jgi:hypothetical protein
MTAEQCSNPAWDTYPPLSLSHAAFHINVPAPLFGQPPSAFTAQCEYVRIYLGGAKEPVLQENNPQGILPWDSPLRDKP